MSEPWWFDYVRETNLLNPFTAVSYLTAAILFWVGWKLTKKIAADWLRVVLRAGLVAIAFAPALLMDPGGGAYVIPASLAAVWGVIAYSGAGPATSFIVYHPLISMLLVWCMGCIVGGVSMKLR